MKNTIYITGHKNPDLDSLCSACAYAGLKNRIDPENRYVAVRCGQLSESVEKQLQIVGVEAPPLMLDVYPKVKDIMLQIEDKPEISEPVYHLVKRYREENPSVTPMFDQGVFKGLLSVDDVTSWFLKDNMDENPRYDFTIENITDVLPGHILHRGSGNAFTAPINVGAASLQDFSEFILKNSDSLIVMGARPEHIKFAISHRVPAIIITTVTLPDRGNPSGILPAINISGSEGVSDAIMPEIDCSDYEGFIYATNLSTVETIRRLRMSEPMGSLMRPGGDCVQISDLFDDAKEMLASSKYRGLAVLDNDTYVGFVTRRCFLDRPAHNIIMVDHNEAAQSIKGIETANIVEIIDHHRLDAMKTDLPILVDARPLGSTCTIVWQQYRANGVVPDSSCAKMLLTGILSDTLILKSPTTTDIDRKAVEELSQLCAVDYREFGEMLYSVTSNLATMPPEKVISSDFKVYDSQGIKVGIGQCETTTLRNIDEYIHPYLDMLEEVRQKSALDWAMLMITNVLTEQSILLSTIYRDSAKLPYEKLVKYNDAQIPGGKGIRAFDMPGVMSRKKQLLPAVLKAIED